MTIKPDGINKTEIPDELMREMRSSIIYMGARWAGAANADCHFREAASLVPVL